MAEEGTQNPTKGTESDISKAQSQQQQPPAQANQQPPEKGERREKPEMGEAQSGQAGEGMQGDTLAQQRTDVEGASLQSEKSETESGFVGSRGEKDTSGEFVEKKDENREGFTPEGK